MCQPRFGTVLGLSVTVLWLSGCATGNRRPDSAQEMRVGQQPLPPRAAVDAPATGFAVDRVNEVLIQQMPRDAAVRGAGDQPDLVEGITEGGANGRIVVIGKSLKEIETSVRAAIRDEAKEEPEPTVARVIARNGNVYYFVGDISAEEIAGRGDTPSCQVQGDCTDGTPPMFWDGFRFFRRKDRPCTEVPVEETQPHEQVSVHELISPSGRVQAVLPPDDGPTQARESAAKQAPGDPDGPSRREARPAPGNAPRSLLEVLPINPVPLRAGAD